VSGELVRRNCGSQASVRVSGTLTKVVVVTRYRQPNRLEPAT